MAKTSSPSHEQLNALARRQQRRQVLAKLAEAGITAQQQANPDLYLATDAEGRRTQVLFRDDGAIA